MRDWAAYDRALVRRGDITVRVSPDAVAAWREPEGRRTLCNAAIAAVLTVRAVFRLPLRQAEGLIASIFALLGLELRVSHHTTLSRRGRALNLDRRARRRPQPRFGDRQHGLAAGAIIRLRPCGMA